MGRRRLVQVSVTRHPPVLRIDFSLRVAYFFINNSSIQFKVCAIFQLSVDMSKWRGSSVLNLSLTQKNSDRHSEDTLWKCAARSVLDVSRG